MKYTFMRTDEELSTTIDVDQPIPHLEAGNSLVIVDEHLALRTGHHFVISHVEMTVTMRKTTSEKVVGVTVYIAEQDRAKKLPRG